MHLLAENISSQLEQKIVKNHAIDAFRKIYYGEDDKRECVTVQEFIYRWKVYNTGDCCVNKTCYRSEGSMSKKLMLLDIQRSGYKLFDPEIASHELLDGST